MSDFDEYIKNKYPSDYLLMTVRYPDQELSELYSDQFEVWQHQQAVIDEHTEVIKIQDADLRKYEKQIESLKAQLNNMEACYIEKKKECEGLQKTNISLEAGLRKNSKNKQKLLGRNIELQKQVDALKGLAQTFWEKSSEKHKQGKVWESKSLGECADEILDELEQALKGGDK